MGIIDLSIDKRAAKLFRVGLGLIVIIDVILRLRHFRLFYTESGVVPNHILTSALKNNPTVYTIASTSTEVGILFGVTIVIAILLVMGYRPHVTCGVLWVLVLSLHHQNPLVINTGDKLLRMLLLWGIFLPIGGSDKGEVRKYSSEKNVVSFGTIGALLQIFLMYFTNVVYKIAGENWLDGSAVEIVFSLGQFTTPIGSFLTNFPVLLKVATFSWLVLLIITPGLFTDNVYVRTAITTGLITGHLGMLVTMTIGVFPLVSMCSLILFYPSEIWDIIQAQYSKNASKYWDRKIKNKLCKSIPNIRIDTPISITERSNNYKKIIKEKVTQIQYFVMPILLAVLILMSTFTGAGVYNESNEIVDTIGIEQQWDMFAPSPVKNETWYVMPATLSNNSTINLYQRTELNKKPNNVRNTYKSNRIRKYFERITKRGESIYAEEYIKSMCEKRNNEKLSIQSAKLNQIRQDVTSNDKVTVKTIARTSC